MSLHVGPKKRCIVQCKKKAVVRGTGPLEDVVKVEMESGGGIVAFSTCGWNRPESSEEPFGKDTPSTNTIRLRAYLGGTVWARALAVGRQLPSRAGRPAARDGMLSLSQVLEGCCARDDVGIVPGLTNGIALAIIRCIVFSCMERE